MLQGEHKCSATGEGAQKEKTLPELPMGNNQVATLL
jgi:hypothetical protein